MDKDVVYICVYTHTRILLGHKKNDILPFATKGMGLEGFSKINQRKINTARYHLYVETKKQKQIDRYSSCWRGEGRPRWGRVLRGAHLLMYTINKLQRYFVQHNIANILQ